MKRAFAIFGVMLLITIAHYATPASFFIWHAILERLYYLPIVVAALAFGWTGGMLAALCAGICYSPFIIMSWNGSPQTMASHYAEMVVFVAVGALTGVLSDRERKRTRELQRTAGELRMVHGQLQSSVDQLKQADRLSAIGQLAASLAHEIRNPLGSIEGAVDICERTDNVEKRREFLAIIKRETGRLNGLLTNLLDFARPRTLQMRPARIEDIVSAVVNLISHSAQQRGIFLKVEIPKDDPLVECDAQQITQALLNVALNALQATPAGRSVSLAVTEQNHAVFVRVRDEGRGVGETDLAKIFDPFFTTKQGGTGLGLSISYQILAQHHGRIIAERNPGDGMTFTLTWPIHGHAPGPASGTR